MSEKACSACGGNIDECQSAVSYDVRVLPIASGATECSQLYGTTKNGETARLQQDSVSDMTYHSHARQKCIEYVNAAMAGTAIELKDLALVRVHARVGNDEFNFPLRRFDNYLGLALNDDGTNKMLEAHHEGMVVAVLSSKLEDDVGFSVPTLVSPDDELVAEYVKSQEYQTALQEAEREFEAAGGYKKAWSVRQNALITHYAKTSIKI